jgi:hypothetical protein
LVGGLRPFDALQFKDDSATHSQVNPLIGDRRPGFLVRCFVAFRVFRGHSFAPEKPATSGMRRAETRFSGKTWFLFVAGCATVGS